MVGVHQVSTPTEDAQRVLLGCVRDALAARLTLQPRQMVERIAAMARPDDPPCNVHVLIWHGGQIVARGCAFGLGAMQGVFQASVHALDVSARQCSIVADTLDRLTFEIMLCTGAEPVDFPKDTSRRAALAGYHRGLRILHDGDIFDLLPYDIVGARTGIDYAALFGLLSDRMNPADLGIGSTRLFALEWTSLVEQRGQAAPLVFRGHRWLKVPDITPDPLLAAAIRCGERVVAQQTVEGTYSYAYAALDGSLSNDDFNMVRMAGTAFGLRMLTAHTHGADRKRFQDSSNAALRFLEGLVQDTTQLDGCRYVAQGAFGIDRLTGKLGTTALTLLALQYGENPAPFDTLKRDLTQTTLALQQDNGAFANLVPTALMPRPKLKQTAQNYFPGQALLALSLATEAAPDADIIASILRAFPYYEAHWTASSNTAFVLWQASAWARIHRLFGTVQVLAEAAAAQGLTQDRVAAFVFSQADWIIAHQQTIETAEIAEYVGGFPNDRTPHSVSSCYLEAVLRALDLADRVGDAARVVRYRTACVEGLRFLRRLQIDPEEAHMFPHPAQAVGGISGTLTSFQMRSDRDQHAITCYLAALETPALFRPT